MNNIAREVLKGIAEGALGCLTGREPVVTETVNNGGGIPVMAICGVATLLVVFSLVMYKCRKK